MTHTCILLDECGHELTRITLDHYAERIRWVGTRHATLADYQQPPHTLISDAIVDLQYDELESEHATLLAGEPIAVYTWPHDT